MIDPMILFNIDAPVEIYGAEGGSGSLLWEAAGRGRRSLCRLGVVRVRPAATRGSIGEHVHHRTEEIYFVTRGRAVMHMDDTASEIGPGDLIHDADRRPSQRRDDRRRGTRVHRRRGPAPGRSLSRTPTAAARLAPDACRRDSNRQPQGW